MRLGLFVVGAGLSVSLVGWCLHRRATPELVSVSQATPPEAAPLCPWREPQADLRAFFPNSDSYKTETLILSGKRPELMERLGHPPAGDDNALHVNYVYQDHTLLGSILTRRVKGEFGGIEIVLAVDPGQTVKGVRLQRLREPESTAAALQDSQWLGAFQGKHPADSWRLGQDLPGVPSAARTSAAAVVDGVRELLILSETANQPGQSNLVQAHHH